MWRKTITMSSVDGRILEYLSVCGDFLEFTGNYGAQVATVETLITALQSRIARDERISPKSCIGSAGWFFWS